MLTRGPFSSTACPSARGQVRAPVLLALTLLVAGCGDDPVTPPAQPSELRIESGDQQSGEVTDALPQPLVVRVVDASGSPVAGVEVSWQVRSGGGSLDASSTSTSADGLAENRWSLGTVAGEQSATAGVTGLTNVEFRATAAPGPPHTILVSPERDMLLVNEARILDASVTDAHGNLIDLSELELVWSSEDASVATVSDQGVVRATGPGSAALVATVGDAVGTAEITTIALSPKTGTRTVGGLAEVPAGLDPEAVYASTLLGGARPVEADGSFQVDVAADDATIVLLHHGAAVISSGIVPASGSAVAGGTSTTTLDATSTAVALVFLVPPFGGAPAGIDGQVLDLISSLPQTDALAEVISSRRSETGEIPGADDQIYQNALVEAYAGLLDVVLEGGSEAVRAWLSADDLWIERSGLELREPRLDLSGTDPTLEVDLTNRLVSWVTLYDHAASVEGEPLEPFDLAPWMLIDPAEPCGEETTTALSWFDDCFRRTDEGFVVPSGPYALRLSFTPEEPRRVLLAYRSAFGSLPTDHVPPERDRRAVATLLTWTEQVILPILAPLTGASGKLASGITVDNAELASQAVLERIEVVRSLSDCFEEQNSLTGLRCLTRRLVWEGREAEWDLVMAIVEKLVPGLTEQFTQEELQGVRWFERALYFVDRTGGAVLEDFTTGVWSVADFFRGEPRVEFDLGYNALIGATRISIVDPELRADQFGYPSEPLPEDPVVEVTDEDGNAVPNAWVTWTVDSGQGSVHGDQTFVAQTEDGGRTSVEWVLGDETGDQHLVARLTGYRTQVEFAGTGFRWSQISGGAWHTCAVTEGGRAFCWGLNDGRLGDGGTTSRAAPVPVVQDAPFVRVSSGSLHGCALTQEGRAYCWGDNTRGQLGDGTTTNRHEPVPVVGDATFSRIDAAASPFPFTGPIDPQAPRHTCALTNGGTAYCWGHNGWGQLGDGTTTDRLEPTRVLGDLDFTEIAVGHAHTCGLVEDGRVYCWGADTQGTLGDGGSGGYRPVPGPVWGDRSFVEISAGRFRTCAVAESGEAYCWGSGPLGDGTTSPRAEPTAVVGDLTFTRIGAGDRYSCGLVVEGGLYCWGRNFWGQLGDGTTIDRHEPVRVTGSDRFQWMSVGAGHTCGVTDHGRAYCWGYNKVGQVGDATTVDRHVPVRVRVPAK